jgi:hypothetical protein
MLAAIFFPHGRRMGLLVWTCQGRIITAAAGHPLAPTEFKSSHRAATMADTAPKQLQSPQPSWQHPQTDSARGGPLVAACSQ